MGTNLLYLRPEFFRSCSIYVLNMGWGDYYPQFVFKTYIEQKLLGHSRRWYQLVIQKKESCLAQEGRRIDFYNLSDHSCKEDLSIDTTFYHCWFFDGQNLYKVFFSCSFTFRSSFLSSYFSYFHRCQVFFSLFPLAHFSLLSNIGLWVYYCTEKHLLYFLSINEKERKLILRFWSTGTVPYGISNSYGM